MLKLLVIEDHTLVREGLVQTLRRLDKRVRVVEAPDCDLALARILHEADHDFDLALLDLGLPGTDGLTCLEVLRKLYPAMPVVIVSAYDDPHTVSRALKNGASGFVPKSYSSEDLIDALREVLDGQIFTPDRIRPPKRDIDLPLPLPLPLQYGEATRAAQFGLTGRQTEILTLVRNGKANREIAEHLGISEGTVKNHIAGVYRLLGVSSRTQALLAIEKYNIML
jgi:DNA-binding NarL/FixJ family response regulator